MKKVNVEKIRGKIGRLIEVEDPMLVEGGDREFLRIRVVMKESNPLVDGFWVSRETKIGHGH